jgi:CRISPR-associated endonuclease Csn1
LFRIRKIATKQYNFLHHLETSVTRDVKLNDAQKSVEIEKIPELRKLSWRRIQSTNGLKGIIKVRINHLGEIVKIGEY